MFCLIFGKVFHMWQMARKPYCKLSFSGFLPSAVPDQIGTNVNYWCTTIISTRVMAYTHVGFRIFSCRTMNNFDKLLAIVAVPNTKQTNWLAKTSMCFYRMLYHLFLQSNKNRKLFHGIRIWEILGNNLLEIIYM